MSKERVVSLSRLFSRIPTKLLLTFFLGGLIMSLGACGTSSANSDRNSHSNTGNDQNGTAPVPVEFKVEEDVQLDAWTELQSSPAGAYWITEDEKTYLVVTAGEKPTAGYVVEVKEITYDGEQLKVSALLNEPRPGDVVAQVITYPMLVLSIPDETLHDLPTTVEWL